jgi:hypothetical protein
MTDPPVNTVEARVENVGTEENWNTANAVDSDTGVWTAPFIHNTF